jgi:hypothetical protein
LAATPVDSKPPTTQHARHSLYIYDEPERYLSVIGAFLSCGPNIHAV